MKKFLSLVLACLLILGSSSIAIAATSNGVQQAAETEQAHLYLVPGTYVSGGKKVENTISGSGVKKLNEEECDAIFTENAYECTLAAGATLPTPTSARVDKDGNAYAFNGWWSIVDATVTYFDKVPALSGDMFLYADWRADLSQRKDPVIPDPDVVVEPHHYMTIKHLSGDTETVELGVTGTDMKNAEDLGYGKAVQLYYIGLTLQPGDVITVYTTGLTTGKEEAEAVPLLIDSYREIQLEANGAGTNNTADFFDAYCPLSKRNGNPYLTYTPSASGTYNLYIKFYSGGSTMAVYMEPMA